jgi:hypothetical protein
MKNDLLPLTKAQITELKRRVKQYEDPRRWVVGSLLPGLKKTRGLYYLVDFDAYTMDDMNATLFKSKNIAVAVGAALDMRDPQRVRKHKIIKVSIEECSTQKKI